MIFGKNKIRLEETPFCNKAIPNISKADFEYYDVDGFELNIAERNFYSVMNFPVNHTILNHSCWQEPWFIVKKEFSDRFILNHAMFLCRAGYSDNALDQLESIKTTIPTAKFLIKTQVKWGFDFSLFANYDEDIFEIIHIEYDSRNFEEFCEKMSFFESFVSNTDWDDAANKVYNMRANWNNLVGFDQNDWKAKYLLGWDKAEYIEKALL